MRDVIEVQFDLTPPTQDQLREMVCGPQRGRATFAARNGEEAPFCGVLLTEKREGVYTCRLCGLPLFKGGAKFESRHRLAELYRALR